MNHAIYQLALGWIVAIAAPTIIYAQIVDVALTAPTHYITAVGATISLVFGVFAFRRLNIFPGLDAGGYVAMCISITFGILAAILVLLRLEYSRVLLLVIYISALIFFTLVHLMFDRRRQYAIGVIPGGRADRLPEFNEVNWCRLSESDRTHLGFDSVVVDLRHNHSDFWDTRIAEIVLQGTPVYDVKQVIEQITGRVELHHLSENNLGSLNPNDVYLQIKQMADFVVALMLLTLLSPLLLLIGLIVRLDSPGPALFRQRRTGYRAKPFTAYKFRTMYISASESNDAEDKRHQAMTQVNDPRVTRVGAFLRRSRLDELPQLLNVLRSDMSLIGPRPEAVDLTKWYEKEIAFYHYRHIIKPGITGWAQINQGHVVSVDDIREKLHLDFYYVKNFSFWLDILIIIRTMWTMVTGRGAK